MGRKGCTARASIWLIAAALGFLFAHQASALMDNVLYDEWRMDPPGTVVALDLGNTNSCVAGYGRGKPETMFQLCIPSWVAFSDDGSVLLGDDAKNHAAVNPRAAAFGFKRLLGRKWDKNHRHDTEVVERAVKAVPYKLVSKDSTSPYIQVETRDGVAVRAVAAEEVAAAVFAKLKEAAEAYLGHRVRGAVVTVPQYCNDHHRDGLRNAGVLSGLGGRAMIRTLREPTAAAIAYGLDRTLPRDGGVAVVLHVGGGTAEASVLDFAGGEFDFLGAHHDPFLGGEDFDQRVIDHFVGLIREKHGVDISSDMGAMRKLREACELAKKTLSTEDHAQLNIESLFDGVDFSEQLSRAQFEELNHDLFLKVLALVERAMAVAELENSKDVVDEIVLIGGSTMIPKIQQLVRDYFHGKKPRTGLKPDEVVAFGAALLPID